MKRHLQILKIVMLALFIALTFVATYISIPLGTSKVHLGNFVCILAGLIGGGLFGGLAGSIGMGLNDLLLGYGPDTYIRTFIVKFVLGFIAGYLFKTIMKKEKSYQFINVLITIFFSITSIIFSALYYRYGETFKIGEKTFNNSLLLVISLSLFAVFFLIITILTTRFNFLAKKVIIASSVAMSLNIILEFIIKIPLKMLFAEMTLNQAFIYAITSLPSALITAMVTIILAALIFPPLYHATKHINKLKI